MYMFLPLWSPVAARQTMRTLTAAHLEAYETAARTVAELQLLLGRGAGCEPLRPLARGWANLTRDATAVQLSSARWILDL
jgi:hypothetical protein